MNKCSCCSKQKELESFIKGNKTLKTCIECRDACKKWKDENKERIKLNNKMSSDNRQNKKEKVEIVCGRKKGEEEWIEYKSQADAAEKLGLYKPNINKVIKKHLQTTGGYEFKIIEKEFEKIEVKTWEEIKEENNFQHKQKGQPAPHRIKHEERENIMGKCCCTCKEWKPLTDYFNFKNHWDNLRNDCKTCLYKYRNNRCKTDPEFKLLRTLRSRLRSALKSKNAIKSTKTLDLIGCSTSFLMGYLDAKFTEGMTWENHGEWHIDHIKPCAKFNLLIEDEQRKCFHYTNLQPLWAKDNLSKSSNY
tara:strand:- start:1325 stop:2239 length:915 start_codon:yes stop_codon:yes gene_type:complete